MNKEGTSDADVQRRIGLAHDTMKRLKNPWNAKNTLEST